MIDLSPSIWALSHADGTIKMINYDEHTMISNLTKVCIKILSDFKAVLRSKSLVSSVIKYYINDYDHWVFRSYFFTDNMRNYLVKRDGGSRISCRLTVIAYRLLMELLHHQFNFLFVIIPSLSNGIFED